MVNGLGRQVSDWTMEIFLAVREACIAIFWPTLGFKTKNIKSGFLTNGIVISTSTIPHCMSERVHRHSPSFSPVKSNHLTFIFKASKKYFDCWMSYDCDYHGVFSVCVCLGGLRWGVKVGGKKWRQVGERGCYIYPFIYHSSYFCAALFTVKCLVLPQHWCSGNLPWLLL